jgi:hypothetical protein
MEGFPQPSAVPEVVAKRRESWWIWLALVVFLGLTVLAMVVGGIWLASLGIPLPGWLTPLPYLAISYLGYELTGKALAGGSGQ